MHEEQPVELVHSGCSFCQFQRNVLGSKHTNELVYVAGSGSIFARSSSCYFCFHQLSYILCNITCLICFEQYVHTYHWTWSFGAQFFLVDNFSMLCVVVCSLFFNMTIVQLLPYVYVVA